MQKAGILGGGQLGRMLLQEAANYPVETFVLENDPECPAAHLCHHFVLGDIRRFSDVYEFGRHLDVITIEIESVNIDALEQLEADGVRVVPTPAALRVITNKIKQKDFYSRSEIPGASYLKVQNRQELARYASFLPAVQKLAEGGYDGRGVQVLASAADLASGFDAPGILEKKIDIRKEISMIIAMDEKGDFALFPPVEMIFDQTLHLLDMQVCPAAMDKELRWRMEGIAVRVARCLQSPGLFAIEFFLDQQNTIYVNETAPRVHNSGHHTIEACYCSQYDMLWRILLEYPIGNPDMVQGAVLVNLIGEPGCNGEARYEGLKQVLAMDNAYVHLYGKKFTKPGRKMGHVTLLGDHTPDLIRRALEVKNLLKVMA